MQKLLGFAGAIFFAALIIFDIYQGYVPVRSGDSPSMANSPIEFWISIGFKAGFVCVFIYLGIRKKYED